MRAVIPAANLQAFLLRARQKLNLSWPQMATEICGVSPRTLRDWRRCRYTIPVETMGKLAQAANLPLPEILQNLDDYWYTAKGGKISGQKVFKRYGNFGTPEGRRLGAQRALATHRRKKTGFFTPKEIQLPAYSADLAEFIGILIGDGSVTSHQVTITLHRVDDREYLQFVRDLCRRLFDIEASLTCRRDSSVCNVVISRVRLISFLTSMGLPIGSKVRYQVEIPTWIVSDPQYVVRCLRGLFDTDGCLYIDRHHYKDQTYYHSAMAFTNRSLPVLNFFKNTLEQLGFHPTQKTPYCIFLRRNGEIIRYFQAVGSSNPKHLNKLQRFLERKGSRRTLTIGGVPEPG